MPIDLSEFILLLVRHGTYVTHQSEFEIHAKLGHRFRPTQPKTFGVPHSSITQKWCPKEEK